MKQTPNTTTMICTLYESIVNSGKKIVELRVATYKIKNNEDDKEGFVVFDLVDANGNESKRRKTMGINQLLGMMREWGKWSIPTLRIFGGSYGTNIDVFFESYPDVLHNLPCELKMLFLYNINVELSNLPLGLEKLNIDCEYYTHSLSNLPSSLHTLRVHTEFLPTSPTDLPSDLQNLILDVRDCEEGKIELVNLPHGLKFLDIGNFRGKVELPPNVEHVWCSNMVRHKLIIQYPNIIFNDEKYRKFMVHTAMML